MDVLVIVAICLAILLLAFYSGIEVAFANANRLGIELKKKQGFKSGILLAKLAEDPSRFIGTVLVGFNLFLVIFILLLSTYSNLLLNQIGITRSFILPARLFTEIIFSLVIVIILGEFIPKALFRTKSDKLLDFFAKSGLLGLSHNVFYPIAAAFVRVSQWILTIIFDMRIDKRKQAFFTRRRRPFFSADQGI